MAIQLLKLFFENPMSFLELNTRKFNTAKEIFYNLHLPFLIHYPLIVLLSPYFWYSVFFKNINIKFIIFSYFYLPLILYFLIMTFIIFFDKLQIYSQMPSIDFKKKYFCLQSSVIVSASILFFILHPILGNVFIMISFLYSFGVGIFLWSKYLKKDIERLFLESILTLALFFVFILIVFVFNNLVNSYYDLKKLGIL